MAADQAGIGADRLYKGILGALGSMLQIRCCKRSLLPCFGFKGNGTNSGKQNNAESVYQQKRYII